MREETKAMQAMANKFMPPVGYPKKKASKKPSKKK